MKTSSFMLVSTVMLYDYIGKNNFCQNYEQQLKGIFNCIFLIRFLFQNARL